MINRYGPVMDTNWVIPIDQENTLVVFDFYFDFEDFEALDAAKFIASSLASSERTQVEDGIISESVQCGLRSPGYNTGRYAPVLEQGEYHFHRLLHEAFSSVYAGSDAPVEAVDALSW